MLKIPRASYKIMPWKNGGGITAEIDRFPLGEGAYLWRLSQATIADDGPFSRFPGFDRWLFLWQGEPITLNAKTLGPWEPFFFHGEESLNCKLAGEVALDVGLIFDRRQIRATMEIVEDRVRLDEGIHYLFNLKSGDTLKYNGADECKTAESLKISVYSQTRP